MKGSIGTATVTQKKLKKPDRIPCDCSKCRHCNKKYGLYCTWFDIVNPKRTSCIRYFGPKVQKKKGVKR